MAEQVLVFVAKFAALSLVTLRLSWLCIEDAITARLRAKLIGWAQRKDMATLALFWECPFCIGFWLAAGVVAGVCLTGSLSLPLPVLWPFAINMVVAVAHHRTDVLLGKS